MVPSFVSYFSEKEAKNIVVRHAFYLKTSPGSKSKIGSKKI
jgi:N-glycosylase/DNA lyase